MAQSTGLPKSSANPFGVLTLDALSTSRLIQDREDMKDRQSLRGASYAAATAGNAIGQALRGYLIEHGHAEDPELKRAEAITRINENARKQVTTTTDPETGETTPRVFKDPYEERIAQGDALIAQLDMAGYGDEADKVRNAMFAVRDAQLKRQEMIVGINAKVADTEAKTQATLFTSLGKPATVTLLDGSIQDPITAQRYADGSISYRNPNTQLREYREPGQYREVKVTGGLNELNPDKVETRNFHTQLGGAAGALRGLTSIREAIRQNPQVGTWSQTMLSYISNVGVQAKSFLENTPHMGGPTAIRDIDGKMEQFFVENNINDKLMRARATSIAYALASSREGGKLTDQDVKLAGAAIGAFDSMPPESRIALMDDFVLNLIDDMSFRANMTGNAESDIYTQSFPNVVQPYKDSMNRFSVPIPGRDPVSLKAKYGIITGAGGGANPIPGASAPADTVRAAADAALQMFDQALGGS